MYVSNGEIADVTWFRCDGTFDYYFATNLPADC